MASKNLFQSAGNAKTTATVTNNAGGKAYDLGPEHTLAQLVCTGCLNGTFYTSDKEQLATVLALAQKCSSEYIAKLAVYARTSAYMKDMPALLCAVLASRKDEQSIKLLKQVFARVCDNTKMIMNFVQIVRSGVTGRKSFGSAPKRLVQSYLVTKDPNKLFADSIGNSPSINDVIRMVRPKSTSVEQDALFQYFIGRKVVQGDSGKDTVSLDKLPSLVREYEAFKVTKTGEVPKVPFQMLASIENLPQETWVSIAKSGGWHMVRMNLNTFLRHGVFNDSAMVKLVADKLRDKDTIQKSKVFPYQLLVAYLNVDAQMPQKIKLALQDALEIATANVPAFEGSVYVLPDVSGSMSSPVTGDRGSATTTVRCIDVAGLVASSVLRTSPLSRVLPFEERVVNVDLNPRDSVMTNARKLAGVGGGSTNCSAPLATIVANNLPVDLVIFVSDNESWLDDKVSGGYYHTRKTETMRYWDMIKAKNPNAKLVNIDIQPSSTSQTLKRKDILNIGGFSDNIWTIIQAFISGDKDWTSEIKSVTL